MCAGVICLINPPPLLAKPAAASAGRNTGTDTGAGTGMHAFAGEAELREFLATVGQRLRAERAMMPVPAPPPPSAPPPNVSIAASAPAGTAAAPQSITNAQTQGVDEGGIVKRHGDHLVILRRGRLFTVNTAGGALTPVAQINVFRLNHPGQDQSGYLGGVWYDEMLIADDMVAVIGYSYFSGGTEINRFDIDREGRLTYRDSYNVRSADYYSSSNYASRLIGNRLITYAPIPLYSSRTRSPDDVLPAMRRWTGDQEAPFTPIAAPQRVFVPDMLRDADDARIDTAHSVTACDLTAKVLNCRATVVLGNNSRSYYASSDAVYLWASRIFDQNSQTVGKAPTRNMVRRAQQGLLYRVPLDGSGPGAIGVAGAPFDQFSFLERNGQINVLLRHDGQGDAMFWPAMPTAATKGPSGGPSAGTGQPTSAQLALLRLPVAEFRSGTGTAAPERYQRLGARLADGQVQNRFVGDTLLFASTPYRWSRQEQPVGATIHTVNLASRAEVDLPSDISVTRIDVMGRDAMVIGTVIGSNGAGEPVNNGAPGQPPEQAREQAGGLAFQAVDLSARPDLQDRYVLPAAAEGESRSHGYFYRADNGDGSSGLLGLPVARNINNPALRFLGRSSAIFFLNRIDRRLSPAGELDADSASTLPDDCQASCTDWYGNARPIFLGDRIIALMGYELVEGRLANGRIQEVQRTSFAPGSVRAQIN